MFKGGNKMIDEEDIKCPYCGHDSSDHPTISIPLGSATCLNGCGCYLIAKHVIKIME
jgi:uncharacterized Zn-finger protein